MFVHFATVNPAVGLWLKSLLPLFIVIQSSPMETMDVVGCDWLLTELGPPPDAILRIPPPPLPHFIDRAYLHEMAAAAAGIGGTDRDNDTTAPCHWCHWARRLDSVGSISVSSGTGMLYFLSDTIS